MQYTIFSFCNLDSKKIETSLSRRHIGDGIVLRRHNYTSTTVLIEAGSTNSRQISSPAPLQDSSLVIEVALEKQT